MRRTVSSLVLAAALASLGGTGAFSQQPAPVAASQNAPAPKLVVAISVDQFSADLFAQYRGHFTGGLARLQQGAVFPSGYQAHAATETCPGHATLLTGARPARTGIIANTWFQPGIARKEKAVYCAEDETDPASTPGNPVVSASHLRVPTLGDRLKAAWPASRNIAVAGKDRSAIMMGGHRIDAGYWWKGSGFTSFAGQELSPAAQAANRAVAASVAKGAPALAVPAWCAARKRSLQVGKKVIGGNRFAFKRGDLMGYRGSPRMDAATIDLAIRLSSELGLGKGAGIDVLSVGLSTTDTIGHTYGHQGVEMCIQLAEVDRLIGRLLAHLDARKVDYVVVLSADHGGIDAPEGLQQQAYPRAVRVDDALLPAALAKAVTARTGIKPASGPLIHGDGPFGDLYLSASLNPGDKAKASAALVSLLKAHSQVAAVFTAKELAEAPQPSASPPDWSLKDRARASFDPERSGDVVALLDRAVVPIPASSLFIATTHGSPWDYDRRVPILFWRKGMRGFEQPAPVETVDIAPSLTAVLGLKVPEGAFDGRCLDLDGGPGNTCEAVK
jgi:predicted AlkP superfamily pyrophosphatase or phosphodiesterase